MSLKVIVTFAVTGNASFNTKHSNCPATPETVSYMTNLLPVGTE